MGLETGDNESSHITSMCRCSWIVLANEPSGLSPLSSAIVVHGEVVLSRGLLLPLTGFPGLPGLPAPGCSIAPAPGPGLAAPPPEPHMVRGEAGEEVIGGLVRGRGQVPALGSSLAGPPGLGPAQARGDMLVAFA